MKEGNKIRRREEGRKEKTNIKKVPLPRGRGREWNGLGVWG